MELLSRRELFKRTLNVLPILFLGWAKSDVIAKARPLVANGCNGNCEAFCKSNCIAQCQENV